MRSPKMAGDECPLGNVVFQSTLVSGPIWSGSGSSRSARPVAFGPRNCAQLPARREAAKAMRNRPANKLNRSVYRMECDSLSKFSDIAWGRVFTKPPHFGNFTILHDKRQCRLMKETSHESRQAEA